MSVEIFSHKNIEFRKDDSVGLFFIVNQNYEQVCPLMIRKIEQEIKTQTNKAIFLSSRTGVDGFSMLISKDHEAFEDAYLAIINLIKDQKEAIINLN